MAYFNENVTVVGLMKVSDSTDPTKQITVVPAGNTSGVLTTIAGTQTTSKTYTLEDVANSNFVMSEGAQTANGVKTLGSAPIVTDIANGIQLNGGTTAQRLAEASCLQGMFRYNTTLKTNEYRRVADGVNGFWASDDHIYKFTSGSIGVSCTVFTPPTDTVSYKAHVYIKDGTTYSQTSYDVINKNGTWEGTATSVGDVLAGVWSVNSGTGVLTYVASGTITIAARVSFINF